MIIIGLDFHPEFQQIAFLNTTTGEVEEKRLAHSDEAEKYYRALATARETVRIGMEASGHARWFERLVAELQFDLWIGDAAEIRAKRGRKQKTDRQDAQHILKLMLKDDFPLRQTGGELSGTGAAGRLQRESPAPGTHHQAGQFDRALSAGGGGTGDGTQPAGVAQQVLSSGAAARTENCESRHGPPAGCSVV